MNLDNPHITIEEVLETLPHKFRSGKNVKIILDAYLKQYNKMLETYADSIVLYNIDKATGDQLDRIGSNFMVRRDNKDDDGYRYDIKLTYAILKTSGNIKNISDVFSDYLGIDIDSIRIYEHGSANIVLDINREYVFPIDIIGVANSIIKFAKPVGVGFNIEQFTNIKFIDTHSGFMNNLDGIELLIDRVKKGYMIQKNYMDDDLSLNEDYFYDIGIDRYESSFGKMIQCYMLNNVYMLDNIYMRELIHVED